MSEEIVQSVEEVVDEKSDVIVVGKSEYPLIKRGRSQAEQVAGIARWIKVYGVPATQELEGITEGTTGVQFILSLIGGLTGDALINLYIVVTGCTTKEAEEYFDVAQLIDVAIATYEAQPSFQKLVDRFLPGLSSTQPSDTPPPDDSAMTSDQPTDG